MPPEMERTAGVFVEDCQVLVGVTGHPDDGRHGQQGGGGGDGLSVSRIRVLAGWSRR